MSKKKSSRTEVETDGQKRERQTRLLQEKPLEITTDLGTKSEEREKDHLNFYSYAQALKEFIEWCATPMTIGLQGDWGTGKTTMLNMLRGEERTKSGLLDEKNCLVVNFETWSYSQFNKPADLPTACLFALTQKLNDVLLAAPGMTDHRKSIGNQADATKKFLLRAVKGVRIGLPFASVDVGQVVEGDKPVSDASAEMIKFKEEFRKLVKIWAPHPSGEKRVVICVDDLDRLQPVVALEMLEAIKNFLDVEGCVFVLAVDYEVVQQGMKAKLGTDLQKTSGKSFFDKIIQLPFNMPKDSYELRPYLEKLILSLELPNLKIPDKSPEKRSKAQKKADEEKIQRFDFIESATRHSVGTNPRSIKRVMNYAKLVALIRDKEAEETRRKFREAGKEKEREALSGDDSALLYAMICMQIAWPELFSHFLEEPSPETLERLESWDYLEGVPELKPMFERAPNVEKLKNEIEAFTEELSLQLMKGNDENLDGKISTEAFKPVLKVLRMARFTLLETAKRPREKFVDDVLGNCEKLGSPEADTAERFITEIFQRSRLFTDSSIGYHRAAERYVTLSRKRKQFGCLVTLKTKALTIRLNVDPEDLKLRLRENKTLSDEARKQLEHVVTGTLEGDSGTGFGDTYVRFEKFFDPSSSNSRSHFDAIVSATEALHDDAARGNELRV